MYIIIRQLYLLFSLDRSYMCHEKIWPQKYKLRDCRIIEWRENNIGNCEKKLNGDQRTSKTKLKRFSQKRDFITIKTFISKKIELADMKIFIKADLSNVNREKMAQY